MLALGSRQLVSRISAGLLGGYFFVWGFTALSIALALAVRWDYDEAEQLAYLLAFGVFLVAFLWAFASANLKRVWIVLAGGGALMTGAAWLLKETLL